MTGTTSPAPVTTGGPRQVSHQQLAYEGTDGNIHLINTDGSGSRTLGAGLDPTWSPDGSRIAFWRGTGNTSGCDNGTDATFAGSAPVVCTGNVWIMNADGSGQHQVIANAMKPAWSPDGRRLAYSLAASVSGNGSEHDLYVANADGTSPHRLTSGFADTDARWSPDGRTILFSRCCISSGAMGWSALYVIGPDGSGLRAVWSSPDYSALTGAWSPDGGRLAFAAYNYGGNKVYIYVLDLSTGGAMPITHGPAGSTWVQDMDYAPAWSPDGRHIAYTNDPDGASGTGGCDAGPTTGCAMGGPQPGTIYLVNPDGSAPSRLVQGSWPSFRPTV
jgi:Tol biopolymer transport system component